MAIFFNQATLTYSGGTVNSNITAGELVESLSITKTAVVDEYSVNSDVTYIINITNSGSVPYGNLTLTDNLGGFIFSGETVYPLNYKEGSVTYFIDGVLQPSPAVTVNNDLVISPISVPAEGVATIAYTVSANEFASPTADGTIENTVTLTGNGIEPINATEVITATAEPVLGITKSVSPTTITENDVLTYTFIIQNTGNTAATEEDNIVITDTFDPAFTNITVIYNGTALTEGVDYTYDSTTGEFQTTSGVITVPAASYTQNPETGEWTSTPGTSTLVVSGNI